VFSLDATGQFLFSGYLPGDSMDVPSAISADRAAITSFVVAGTSRSDNYPTFNALQATNKHGGTNRTDLVVTRMRP
ncbi:MAG TPA: hypothetical protein VF698_03695, partial [Thermoanaerobaculia bacterium]